MYAALEPVLIGLLVLTSVVYVARATWRGIRNASRSDGNQGCGGCNGCGTCPSDPPARR